MKKVCIALALFIVAGCATYGPSPLSAAPRDPTPDCLNSLASSSSLAPLSTKMMLNGVQPTFEMLSNTSYATEEEKPLIAKWADERQKCVQQGESIRQANMPPAMHGLISNTQAKIISLAADLYNRKITYGQFTQERSANNAEFKSKFDEIVQQQESARRQAAAQILANQPQFQIPQQRAYQMPVPTTTQCNTFGTQTTCITR